MAPPVEGWGAVLDGVSLPAVMLALLTAVLKGPSLLRMVSREWRQEAAEERREVDSERKEIADWKDRELERLRDVERSLSARVQQLLGRIHELMNGLEWWRDYARESRHERQNDRQKHILFETQAGLKPLLLPEIPRVPAISEQTDAAEYED